MPKIKSGALWRQQLGQPQCLLTMLQYDKPKKLQNHELGVRFDVKYPYFWETWTHFEHYVSMAKTSCICPAVLTQSIWQLNKIQTLRRPLTSMSLEGQQMLIDQHNSTSSTKWYQHCSDTFNSLALLVIVKIDVSNPIFGRYTPRPHLTECNLGPEEPLC